MSTMVCPSTPPRDVLMRSRLHYENFLSADILQQERHHAASKKPRRTRFVLEADSKIQGISKAVVQIRKRVLSIHTDMKTLEGKINRLDVVKEQACFFMSPKRVLGSAGLMARRSPMKLTYVYPEQCSTPTFPSSGNSSPDQGYSSPTQDKLVEFVRRRKLVAINLSKVLNRLNEEKKRLDGIFQNNTTILRYKRAEKSLIKIISLQNRLRILGKEFEGLEERLFSEDSFDEDSSYNLRQAINAF